MSAFVRAVKSISCLICVVALLFAMTTFPSLADDCGKSDRVAVPQCLDIKAGNGVWNYKNNCSHAVTLKFDQSGADRRPTLKERSQGGLFFNRYKESAKISCCPRYNSCSNN